VPEWSAEALTACARWTAAISTEVPGKPLQAAGILTNWPKRNTKQQYMLET